MNIIQVLIYVVSAMAAGILGVLCYFTLMYARLAYSDMSLIYEPGNRVKRIYHSLKGKDRFVDLKRFYHVDYDTAYRNNQNRVVTTHWINEPNPLRVGPNKSEWVSGDGIQRLLNNQVIKDIVTPKDEKQKWILIVVVVMAFLILLVSAAVALKIFGVWK